MTPAATPRSRQGAIDDQEPKYRLPAGFRKSLALVNLHRALATGARNIIVEGFFDTLALHQPGYPAVIGLMGSTLSRYQADLLVSHFDRVVLMLDGDEAGRQGAMTIAQTLGVHMSVSAISLEDGRQPDQLSAAAIGQQPQNHEHRNDEPLKHLRQPSTDAEERLTSSAARPAGGQATRTVPTASPILHDIPGIELSSPNERLRTDPAEATKVRGEAFDAGDPGPGPQFVMQVRE
jgi:5S rRNA maturation endonuclease (ribonuclease M5)